jgi:hypothetical protein
MTNALRLTAARHLSATHATKITVAENQTPGIASRIQLVTASCQGSRSR